MRVPFRIAFTFITIFMLVACIPETESTSPQEALPTLAVVTQIPDADTTPTREEATPSSSTPIPINTLSPDYVFTPGDPTATPPGEQISDPNYLRGKVAYVDANYAEVINLMTSVLEANSELAPAYWYRGMSYWSLGNSEAGLVEMEQALAIDPNYALAYADRALLNSTLGNLDQAIADWQRALSIDPSLAKVHHNIGYMYYQQGNYQMAIDEYTLAVQIDPTRARTWVSLADTYFQAGLYEECIQTAEMIDDSNAALWLDYFYKGSCKSSLGQYEEGFDALTTYVESAPNDSMGWYNRGIAQGRLGNYEAAVSDYAQSIALNPSYPPAYINRGMTYLDMGEVELALADYNKALSFGEIPNAYWGRANVYQAMGNYEDAIRDYQRAIELYPYEPATHGHLAETYLFTNQYREAVDSATTALSLGAGLDEALILQRRGRAYIGMGLYKEAITDLNTSIEIHRAFDSFYYRGVAYHENGQNQLAISDLQLFLDNLRPGVEVEAEDARRRLSKLGQ